jgi:predicted TIM-barrel fold metal-dependent hydrolase
MTITKIDCYTHIVPKTYWAALRARIGEKRLVETVGGELKSIESTRTLLDLDERLRIMDKYEGLAQILVPTGPPLDLVTSGQTAVDLARICNDGMAEVVAKYPDRFLGAVAVLPLGDIDDSMKETERAIHDLHFKGVLLTTPRYGQSVSVTKPPDTPDMIPLYELMLGFDLPIWIHPRREYLLPDYTVEKSSKYCLNQCFGWPYETTLCMARLVYGGILARYPTLKFITHHAGAMVPSMADRIEGSCEWYEMALKARFTKQFPKRPIEYFRLFYNDTAIYGNTSGLMCAYSFFGADRLLFGTDFPYDAQCGDTYTRKTIEAIEAMGISSREKKSIFADNARKLLKLPGTGT